MKVQTFSILAGNELCNSKCPYCISRLTPSCGMDLKEPVINWRNFRLACRFAILRNVATAMLTGKGEPTMFPDLITKYLDELAPFGFPFVELQTNGIRLMEEKEKFEPLLKEWFSKGLTTIAISVVHYDAEKNRKILTPHKESYIEIPDLVKMLHSIGFTVRLICILTRYLVDNSDALFQVITFAKEHQIEQLTFTPVSKPPDRTKNPEVWDWVNTYSLLEREFEKIYQYLLLRATPVMELLHGAMVFDMEGQNVCLNNCLTIEVNKDFLRNLIFYPDGHLRYYWEYPGATLL